MRISLLVLTLIVGTTSNEQGVPLDHYTTDTLHLSPFKAKKTILYKLNTVTFAVDYNDFIKMYSAFWKREKEGQKYIAKAKKKGEYYNPNSTPMWIVLDSVYKAITLDIKHKDTLFINHAVFSKAGFGTWNNFFPELIERNRCAIFNNKNEQQFIIIRQKGSWYRGQLEAWGGRRYFILGQSNYFIEGTDWIS
jgi:hypothetical protein